MTITYIQAVGIEVDSDLLNQEGHHQADSEGHVHFPAEQVQEHDLEIIVKSGGDNQVDVHLGFLQFKHLYEVKFCIKDDLGEDVDYDPLQNLHVKIENVQPTEDGTGHEILLNFNAHREKLLTESILLKSRNDKEKYLTLVLHARVLGGYFL
ncbi:hypothetical protein LOTGIDRAFT_164258 [Lottia gigantea]|uniref:Adipose-secreted signaling protein n=1 Tax=Lottia gigantea TaxID=225164 RepID=V4BNC3_LOTGI|nr:hypothetical protein LOTGIDRAFT_164258 [Lottia gigantea]ESO90339.1 hypothetical protein LOTGIDRAFT_164258 [Lottia gigantea]